MRGRSVQGGRRRRTCACIVVAAASVRARMCTRAGRQAGRRACESYRTRTPRSSTYPCPRCNGPCAPTVRRAPQCARYRRACAVSSSSCLDRPTCVYCTRGGLACCCGCSVRYLLPIWACGTFVHVHVTTSLISAAETTNYFIF